MWTWQQIIIVGMLVIVVGGTLIYVLVQQIMNNSLDHKLQGSERSKPDIVVEVKAEDEKEENDFDMGYISD